MVARSTPLFLLIVAAELCLPCSTFSQGVSNKEIERQLSQATVLRNQGRYAEALAVYERILPAAEAIYGKNGKTTAEILNNMGLACAEVGQFSRAETFYLRTLASREAAFGRNHFILSSPLTNLGNLYRTLGHYAKSEPLQLRSLALREAQHGMSHPRVADGLTNLGLLYIDMRQRAKAEPLFLRSLSIREAHFGKDSLAAGRSLNNLGYLYWGLGQPEKAEPYYLRSLAIVEAQLGKDHTLVASSLSNLGNVYHDLGQHEKAHALYQRSLDIREARLGKDHPELALALYNLAMSYDALHQYEQAEPLYLRSLDIRKARFGNDHPVVADTLYRLVVNSALKQDWPKAVAHAHKARQATARHLADLLPALSEKEQLTYLHDDGGWRMQMVLSLGWAAPGQASAASAEWLLNARAVAHQSLAEQHILARDARDPAARNLVEALQQTRARLATLVNVVPGSGWENKQQSELQNLRAREQDMARQVARAVGRPFRTNSWVTLDELRARLAPTTAFVDIRGFRAWDFKKQEGKLDRRYVAWITPPGNAKVQIIDLGEAEAIDRLVAQTRQALLTSAKSTTKVGEIEAWETLQKPLKELSARVLHPLLPTLGKYEEWIVCPDGALWLTPWNALLLPDGKFTVEKHPIRHVVSGRDLVIELPGVKAEGAAIFADPDFDLSPRQVMKLAGQRPSTDNEELRSTGTANHALPKVPRLPGTAAEAAAMRPKLQHWLGQEPKVFLEGQASEATLKALKGPRVLTLATHGYFLPTQEVKHKDHPGLEPAEGNRSADLIDKKSQPIENPLLRCGLLLAGCNKRAEAEAGEDDGILTGLEIVGLDLRGCELVVLSACETGLGDVRNGEGVAGLRQAFQLAGARAVLASLWQVPDRETALLMNTFYGELARGRSQAQALRQAQLQRIAARRAQFGAAHPFFWAAFTLTSRGTE